MIYCVVIFKIVGNLSLRQISFLEKMKIETVVSQGSTLGTFHILPIVNGLYLAIEESKIFMFADEFTIVNSCKASNPL